MHRAIKLAAIVILCLAAAAAAFSAGFATHMVFGDALRQPVPQIGRVNVSTTEPDPSEAGAFEIFWQAWHLLEDNYLGEVPSLQRATYSAIRGVLAELGDPHTIFVEPQRRQLEKDEHRGRFGGIGVWIYQRESDRQFVLVPLEESPAQRAGILEGDILQGVNGTAIDPIRMSQDQVVAMIRGPVGEMVRIEILRESTGRRHQFNIVREEFQTPSVNWRMLEEPVRDIGYVQITLFTERTGGELEKALKELRARGAARLILDLRNNPGGLLDAAVDVGSQFLREGTMLHEQHKDGSEKAYPVRKGGIATDLPLVVLVNGGTASGAEIVAGAIQDLRRGTLIGEKTYGKGSVQLVFDLLDGSSIHITVARWLTPSRHKIDGNGIVPDLMVSASESEGESDPQLTAAIQHLISQAQGR